MLPGRGVWGRVLCGIGATIASREFSRALWSSVALRVLDDQASLLGGIAMPASEFLAQMVLLGHGSGAMQASQLCLVFALAAVLLREWK
jgi:hypothetical protein